MCCLDVVCKHYGPMLNIISYYIILYNIVLHCIALQCIVQHYIVLHDIVLHYVMLCNVTRTTTTDLFLAGLGFEALELYKRRGAQSSNVCPSLSAAWLSNAMRSLFVKSTAWHYMMRDGEHHHLESWARTSRGFLWTTVQWWLNPCLVGKKRGHAGHAIDAAVLEGGRIVSAILHGVT